MRDHFTLKGLNVVTLNKSTVTTENMISRRIGFPNKARQAMDELERRKMENFTSVKIENSLLCQQNTELI